MRRRGFTLLEVIVSLVLLATGLVMVMEAFTVGLRTSAAADRRSVAALLLQDKMEELKKEPLLTSGSDEGDFGEDFEEYMWRVDISETDVPGLVHVAVTVSWMEPRGEDDLSIATLARGGQAVEDKLQEREAESAGGAMR